MSEKEKECPSLECPKRPNFRKGQRLTAERFNRLYEVQSRKMQQALLGVAGSGVVYGFAIRESEGCEAKDCIYIDCGLAIDCHGRLLYWKGGDVCFKDLAGPKPRCDDEYTLGVHYAERRRDEQEQPCNENEADWVEECVVFSLDPKPPDPPEPCKETNLECQLLVCRHLGTHGKDLVADECLKKICCEVEPPGHVACDLTRYDGEHSLPLARIKIKMDKSKDECGCPKPAFGSFTTCPHRQFVYRNPLLMELIRRGRSDKATRVCRVDLPKDCGNSWEKAVKWEHLAEWIERGPEIEFTDCVRIETINDASVFVTAIVREQDSYFKDVLRLPVEEMIFDEDEKGLAKKVRLIFSDDWIKNQVHSPLSRFSFGTVIEITVRGSMVRDRCGQLIDGRPLKEPEGRTHPAMPGDDFVVAFRVGWRPLKKQTRSGLPTASEQSL